MKNKKVSSSNQEIHRDSSYFKSQKQNTDIEIHRQKHKNSKARKISHMGLLLAFNSIIYILVNYITTNTITLLIIASLPVIVVVIEFGLKDGVLYSLSSILLALILINNKMYFISYLFTFASYPLIKALVEKAKVFWLELGLKLAYASTVFIIIYLILGTFFSMKSIIYNYIILIFIIYNVSFLIYDWVLSQFVIFYLDKLSKIIKMR
nr:hypothetical protein [uncultured Peptostreptococcus sp.]